MQAVNRNRNDPWIVAVQPLQVSFAVVYGGKDSPDLAREPDRIISMESCFHFVLGCFVREGFDLRRRTVPTSAVFLFRAYGKAHSL